MSAPAAPPAAPQPARSDTARHIIMFLAAIACLLPWINPPRALIIGVILALLGLTTRTRQATKLAKLLIQIAVVMLGLGMDLRQVADAGLVGLAFAAGTIAGTFALGILLGRLLRIDATLTTLLSSGTAICGGSAIAATASVIGASESAIAVAMGAIFLLNALAIYIFPHIGHDLAHLSAHQFGTWAAVAIHDVSSVVTAAGEFDKRWPDPLYPALASQTATAVKLTRTLWIVPVALACAWWFRKSATAVPARVSANGISSPADVSTSGIGLPADVSAAAAERLLQDASPLSRARTHDETSPSQPARKPKIPIPWFVLYFLLAAVIGTLFKDGVAPLAVPAADVAKTKLMSVALLLIGSALSPKAILSVGWRAMLMAILLWAAITAAALWVVHHTVP